MLRKVARFIVAVVGALLVAAGAPSARASIFTPGIPFPSPGSPGNTLALDLYLPDSGVPTSGITVIMVHGGSYNAGSRTEMGPIAGALADLGYAVVDPDYTLVTPTAASYPQPISDILNAVHWIRTDGQTLGLPDEIMIFGSSAGATVGITAAFASQTMEFDHLPAPSNRGYIIDGAIGAMGRYDLIWNTDVGVPQTVIDYLGVQVYSANWYHTYSQASAITYVNSCSPPTVLYHGDNDGLVPIGNSYHLNSAMLAAGTPVQLHIVPGGTHDITVIGATTVAQAQTLAAASQWIDANLQAQCGRTSIAHPAMPPPPPPPTGACCDTSGSCGVSSFNDCPAYWIQGATCDPTPCPQLPPPPSGACCMGATCAVTLASSCAGGNRRFGGASSACNVLGNRTTPCCNADFTQDGRVNVADIFAFLAGWFSGSPDAAVSSPAGSRPIVQDIFDFLSAWFSGC